VFIIYILARREGGNKIENQCGATINQFLVQSALKEAQAVIERERVIRMSARDWGWMLGLLENPPKPNAKLKASMKRYQKAKRDDAVTTFNWQP
jgi:uncharacterized protein (DUF1778 family)